MMALLLAAVSMSLVSVSAQLTKLNSSDVPYSWGFSYAGSFSSMYSANYSSNFSIPPVPFNVPSQPVGNNNPTFDFLNPNGLRITILGPLPHSQNYLVKLHININREFSGIKKGEYEEKVDIPSGSPLSHTFPDIRLREGDTIYYWVEVEGKMDTSTWFREYTGFYPVLLSNHQAPQNAGLPHNQ